MQKLSFLLSLCFVLVLPYVVQAAFIVEPYSDGLGYTNFAGTPSYSTAKGTAPGLIGTRSAYGNTLAFPDIYTFSYTPGSNADNWDTPNFQYFGNGFSTTNLAGGQTGYYNVYITWPASTSVTSLCNITVNYAGGSTTISDVNMNDTKTIAMAQAINPNPPPPYSTANYVGGNNAWLRIATEVPLTANTTYTVTQSAQQDKFVSMRSAGVMWEFVAIPEPATVLVLGLGALLIVRRRG